MIVYWKQRNGDLISVDEMSINHLRNTLKMIIRANNKTKKFDKKFQLKGDMAEQFNSSQEEYEYDYDYPYI